MVSSAVPTHPDPITLRSLHFVRSFSAACEEAPKKTFPIRSTRLQRDNIEWQIVHPSDSSASSIRQSIRPQKRFLPVESRFWRLRGGGETMSFPEPASVHTAHNKESGPDKMH